MKNLVKIYSFKNSEGREKLKFVTKITIDGKIFTGEGYLTKVILKLKALNNGEIFIWQKLRNQIY